MALSSNLSRPQILYKYVSVNVARLILANGTLRWSTPGTLNDPYDIQLDFQLDIDRIRVRDTALEKLRRAFYGHDQPTIGNRVGVAIQLLRQMLPTLEQDEFDREIRAGLDESLSHLLAMLPEVNAQIRALMLDSKVLCLSASNDNVLMWAHYADSHKGVVLGFHDVPGVDSPWREARPIEYVNELPQLLDEELLARVLAGEASLDRQFQIGVMDRLVYTKFDQWSYEQEWRLFSGSGRNGVATPEYVPFHPRELACVIAGCSMQEAERRELFRTTQNRYPSARTMSASRGIGSFRLRIE